MTTATAAGDTPAQRILDELDESVTAIEEAASRVAATVELFDNQRPCVTDVTLPDGTRVHKFQMMRESMDLPFADDEDTEWVVTNIDVYDQQVTAKIPGPWDQTTITFEELMTEEYEPLTHGDGTPMWGY